MRGDLIMKNIFFRSLRLALFIGGIGIGGIGANAFSATPPLSPDLTETTPPDNPATPEELTRARSVNVTEPPNVELRTATPAYLYRFRNSMSFRTGAALTLSDLGNPGPINGFAYWFPIDNERHELKGIEIGTDLEKNSTGSIHAALRHVMSQDSVRYFYKLGLGLNIVASDQLVTVLRLKNWQARGGFGIEVSLSDPISLRWDIEGHVSSEQNRLLTALGISFGW